MFTRGEFIPSLHKVSKVLAPSTTHRIGAPIIFNYTFYNFYLLYLWYFFPFDMPNCNKLYMITSVQNE